jgi:hypothetical protein
MYDYGDCNVKLYGIRLETKDDQFKEKKKELYDQIIKVREDFETLR